MIMAYAYHFFTDICNHQLVQRELMKVLPVVGLVPSASGQIFSPPYCLLAHLSQVAFPPPPIPPDKMNVLPCLGDTFMET